MERLKQREKQLDLKETLEGIKQYYGLEIGNCRKLSSSTWKSVVQLRGDATTHIAKIYHMDSPHIDRIERILEFAASIPHSSVLPALHTNEGKYVAKLEGGTRAIVYPDYSKDVLVTGSTELFRPGKMGQALGKFHTEVANLNMARPTEYNSMGFSRLVNEQEFEQQTRLISQQLNTDDQNRVVRVAYAARDIVLGHTSEIAYGTEDEKHLPIGLRKNVELPLQWVHGCWTVNHLVDHGSDLQTFNLDHMRLELREVDVAISLYSMFFIPNIYSPQRHIVPFLLGYSETANRVKTDVVASWSVIHAIYQKYDPNSDFQRSRLQAFFEWATNRLL